MSRFLLFNVILPRVTALLYFPGWIIFLVDLVTIVSKYIYNRLSILKLFKPQTSGRLYNQSVM